LTTSSSSCSIDKFGVASYEGCFTDDKIDENTYSTDLDFQEVIEGSETDQILSGDYKSMNLITADIALRFECDGKLLKYR
jgi:hypothetical protein